jgi:thymidine kinase
MALYTTLGTMKSGKTSALIKKQKEIGVDTRVVLPLVSKSRDLGDVGRLQSRDGSWTLITHYISKDDDILQVFENDTNCVFFIDEIQFFTLDQIQQLYELSCKTDVYAYGLEKDFLGKEFESSQEIKKHCLFFEKLFAMCEVCFKEKAVQDCLIQDLDNGINSIYKSKCVGCAQV